MRRKKSLFPRQVEFHIFIVLVMAAVASGALFGVAVSQDGYPNPGHPGIAICDDNLCVTPGKVGVGTTDPQQLLEVKGIYRGNQGDSNDVWIQGGASSAGGDARNLALLGSKGSDRLYVNYPKSGGGGVGEYDGGTQIGRPVGIGRTPSSSYDLIANNKVRGGQLCTGSKCTSNIRFQVCIQFSDNGCGNNAGTERCTPCYSGSTTGWSSWATDNNAFDPDCARMRIKSC